MTINFVREVLYGLKRDYGKRLDIYQIVSSDFDLETGEKTVKKNFFTVRLAILLPQKIARDFQYDLSFIAASKNFTYGGTLDKQDRIVIVAGADVPKGYQPKLGDYFVIASKRYTLKSFQDLDEKAGLLFEIQALEGELPISLTDVNPI